MPTVSEIVKQWLSEHGYDGLFSDDCGCHIDDLMPCDGGGEIFCEAGYQVKGCTCGEGCDFHIVPHKPEKGGEDGRDATSNAE